MSVAVETSAERRLLELAEIIGREHQLARQAAHAMLEHALACGDALLEAKAMLPAGEWGRWVEQILPDGTKVTMCGNYMRLAYLREHIDPEMTLTANLRALRGVPGVPLGTQKHSEETKQRAREMYADGVHVKRIAREVGASHRSVSQWVVPGYLEADRDRQNATRRANGTVKGHPVPQTPHDERVYRYGEPGRAAITQAVRKIATTSGRKATREALLDLAAICSAWAERLESSTSTNV